MVLGFLAVVGKGLVVAQARQFDRHGRHQRDALVGRAKQHVVFDAAGQDALRIELGQPSQHGAVIEQARIEEVGRLAAGLGDEAAEAQHAAVHRKGNEIFGQMVDRGRSGGGLAHGVTDSNQ